MYLLFTVLFSALDFSISDIFSKNILLILLFLSKNIPCNIKKEAVEEINITARNIIFHISIGEKPWGKPLLTMQQKRPIRRRANADALEQITKRRKRSSSTTLVAKVTYLLWNLGIFSAKTKLFSVWFIRFVFVVFVFWYWWTPRLFFFATQCQLVRVKQATSIVKHFPCNLWLHNWSFWFYCYLNDFRHWRWRDFNVRRGVAVLSSTQQKEARRVDRTSQCWSSWNAPEINGVRYWTICCSYSSLVLHTDMKTKLYSAHYLRWWNITINLNAFLSRDEREHGVCLRCVYSERGYRVQINLLAS